MGHKECCCGGVRLEPGKMRMPASAEALMQEAKSTAEEALRMLSHSIERVEQTVVSDDNEGVNVLTVTQRDGTQIAFRVKNGSQGERGERGPQGERGERGPQGEKGADGTMRFSDLTPAQKLDLKGDKGEQGDSADVEAANAATQAANQWALQAKAATVELETKTTDFVTLKGQVTAATADAVTAKNAALAAAASIDGVSVSLDTTTNVLKVKGTDGVEKSVYVKGAAFTYADFTTEQLAALKGADGADGEDADVAGCNAAKEAANDAADDAIDATATAVSAANSALTAATSANNAAGAANLAAETAEAQVEKLDKIAVSLNTTTHVLSVTDSDGVTKTVNTKGEKGDKGVKGDSGYTGAADELQVVHSIGASADASDEAVVDQKAIATALESLQSLIPDMFIDTVESGFYFVDSNKYIGAGIKGDGTPVGFAAYSEQVIRTV